MFVTSGMVLCSMNGTLFHCISHYLLLTWDFVFNITASFLGKTVEIGKCTRDLICLKDIWNSVMMETLGFPTVVGPSDREGSYSGPSDRDGAYSGANDTEGSDQEGGSRSPVRHQPVKIYPLQQLAHPPSISLSLLLRLLLLSSISLSLLCRSLSPTTTVFPDPRVMGHLGGRGRGGGGGYGGSAKEPQEASAWNDGVGLGLDFLRWVWFGLNVEDDVVADGDVS
ncbi:hypothetical protein LWI28_021824 [Acer negundo]|uniref:Uncharacterized protein n=1 Tax=Acer negundo TaxID=4023 RepID=A0AAD5NVT1_ACENE|nr:hypothetical protein LWI28_021824 [Acer negundo]